jgi:hypothetical protein
LNHGTNKCLHSFFYRFSKNINLYSLVCYYLPFFKLNCTVTATLSQGLGGGGNKIFSINKINKIEIKLLH